jgi:hypothetical protein
MKWGYFGSSQVDGSRVGQRMNVHGALLRSQAPNRKSNWVMQGGEP